MKRFDKTLQDVEQSLQRVRDEVYKEVSENFELYCVALMFNEDPSMEAFCEMEKIKERGNWGGEEVLQTFSKIYEVVIEIFKHDGTLLQST